MRPSIHRDFLNVWAWFTESLAKLKPTRTCWGPVCIQLLSQLCRSKSRHSWSSQGAKLRLWGYCQWHSCLVYHLENYRLALLGKHELGTNHDCWLNCLERSCRCPWEPIGMKLLMEPDSVSNAEATMQRRLVILTKVDPFVSQEERPSHKGSTPSCSWQIGCRRPRNPFRAVSAAPPLRILLQVTGYLFPATPWWPLELICVLNNGLIVQLSLPHSLLVHIR